MEDSYNIDLASLSPYIINDYHKKKLTYSTYLVALSVSSLVNNDFETWSAQDIDYVTYNYKTIEEAEKEFDSLTQEETLKNHIARYLDIEPVNLLVQVSIQGKEEIGYPVKLVSDYVTM